MSRSFAAVNARGSTTRLSRWPLGPELRSALLASRLNVFMCRLVSYAGPPLSLDRLVFHGGHSLYRQSWAARELVSGSVNADGWGVTWWAESLHAPVRLARAEPIWYDPELRTVLTALRGAVAQAALRNATPGLPVESGAVLPLTCDGWSFSLNGWVPDFRPRHMRALRTELTDAGYARLKGVSDAETLFLLVVDALRAGEEPAAALRAVADRVAGRLTSNEGAPFTMVLGSSEGAVTLHGVWGDGPANSLYLTQDPAWAPGGTVLASEPLDGVSVWEPIPPRTLVVQRRDGRVQRRS